MWLTWNSAGNSLDYLTFCFSILNTQGNQFIMQSLYQLHVCLFACFENWLEDPVAFGPVTWCHPSWAEYLGRWLLSLHHDQEEKWERGRGVRVSISFPRDYVQCPNFLPLSPIPSPSTNSQWHHELETSSSTHRHLEDIRGLNGSMPGMVVDFFWNVLGAGKKCGHSWHFSRAMQGLGWWFHVRTGEKGKTDLPDMKVKKDTAWLPVFGFFGQARGILDSFIS